MENIDLKMPTLFPFSLFFQMEWVDKGVAWRDIMHFLIACALYGQIMQPLQVNWKLAVGIILCTTQHLGSLGQKQGLETAECNWN